MKPATAVWLRSWLAARIRPGDDSPAAEADREARFQIMDRELAKTRPPDDEHARRLAGLLGLRAGGDADAA